MTIVLWIEVTLDERRMAAERGDAETERRLDRRVGQLIRQGQVAGEITVRHRRRKEGQRSPDEFFSHGGKASNGIYKLADCSDEEFEKALVECRNEENLSRANFVRKLTGTELPPIDDWHRGKKKIDSDKILRETALSLRSVCSGLDLLDPARLDALERLNWIESIRGSMDELRAFVRRINNGG